MKEWRERQTIEGWLCSTNSNSGVRSSNFKKNGEEERDREKEIDRERERERERESIENRRKSKGR